ncbi:hypothetical protein FJ940_18565 [Mesorhizobium sp. B2-3-7]|nr:hypothetical protein FJ489_24305 [Mesorhizobium sp. B2-5-12]TPK24150.1 hypothetical protein FJ562_18330 [Mesorhizobium sp. B2-5-6]TPM05253.1 hypothetical protein FJ939_17250 [Mesorhizobium sp. B2-3-8]TPM13136.1 hypothetical protein FJ940_18565 [Mesorhizobium sp. B2-3-7]
MPIPRAGRSTAPPSVLPDISPTWGEIGSLIVGSLFLQRRRLAKAVMTANLPTRGEMSGRTEGGAVERDSGC